MEYREISNIKIKASRVGLGTWAMGGSLWGASDEQESIATILNALKMGITVIDTAPGYGFGVSEEVVGKALKLAGKRDEVIVATKCGLNLHEEYNVYRDSRKASILKEIDDSLRRLQTDYIDIYQVHWPDPHTSQEETAETLNQLLQSGKIRAIGVSNYTLEEIEAFRKIASIQVIQHPFNIFERESEETVLNLCLKEKVTSIGYSSLCRGLLTGTLRENHEFEDLRKNFDPKFRKPHFDEYLVCVGRLEQWVRDKYKKTLIALAVRWSLDKGVDVALWGARKPEELDPITELIGWKLVKEDFDEIDDIIKESISMPIGPQFMSPPVRNHSIN